MNKKNLRPVIVLDGDEVSKGYFHRYAVYQRNYTTITYALIELEDGQLKYFDPELVQFTDRYSSNNSF